MTWRALRFFLFELVGGLLGYLLLPLADAKLGAIVGIVAASALWVLVDLRRGHRLLVWLRLGDSQQAPALAGLWGEAGDRMRRLMRGREQQLAVSENRLVEFLAAIQASSNGVVLIDGVGRIEWCNQTAVEHFGFDAQRDVLQHLGNLLRDPSFAAYQAGGDYSGDIVIPGPQSSTSRPVRLALQLHRYGEGRTLLLSRDVTALEQAEAMRRDFVANVSHEIRTPLTVLSGFVETLQNLRLDDADRQRYLALMAQQAQRMHTLVVDLLTLSRLEGSPLPRADEWVDIRRLIEQCAQEGRELSSMVAPQGQQISVEVQGAWELAGSEAELHSAMANLVNNAVRYTPALGSIGLHWRVDPQGQGEFCVSDSGPGIEAEHLPRLTERFYRVDRSRSRDSGGTGLGLAIVKHVAQRHGAQLRIASKPGQGSRFCMVFPLGRVRASAAS